MSASIDVAELVDFIDKFQPNESLGSDDRRAIFKRPYRQYHALLGWGLIADDVLDKKSESYVYFQEFISDLAHSLLLTLFHFYKPSRMCMRSAAENFARFITINDKIDLKSQKSTYELLDAVKLASSSYPNMRSEIDKVCAIYAELCLTVHSAKVEYMTLKVPFAHLTKFDAILFGSNLHIFLRLATALNRTLFLYWGSKLEKIGHKNADLIRDTLPSSLKRKFYEL